MNGSIKSKKTRQGYTLLEILVVLALISIILSIAIPSIKVIGNFEEKKEMKNFRRDIISARNMAIIEGSIYVLTIYEKDNSYIIKSKGEVIKNIKLAYWEIMPENTLDSKIKFLSTGSPDKGGTIGLKNKRKKITKLTILPVTGKLNVYENK